MKRTLGLLLIVLHAPLASAVYKCVDEHGSTLFGDVPPAGCGNVPIYEVSKSGAVLRRIDPTPTPQQVELQREERERREKEEKIAAEQRRKDMALLNTFGSAKEFDMARDRNIEPVHGRITASEERIKELDQRERQIQDQIEQYSGRPARGGKLPEPPAWLLEDLKRVKAERASLKASIERNRKEIEAIRTRYDADKKRWITLKATGGIGALQAAEPQPEPVKAPAHRRLGS